MKSLDVIAAVLLVVGGLNWGLVGLFGFDLVATLAGPAPAIASIVYVLVGVAALYQLAGLPWIQARWNVSPRLAAAS